MTALFRIVAKYVTFEPSLLRPCDMGLNHRDTFNSQRTFIAHFNERVSTTQIPTHRAEARADI